MFDTVFGIPTHALVVHAVVVLAPLTALLLVLVAVSERLRARIGIALPLLATVSAISGFVAKESGESLERRVGESNLVEEHAELGDVLPIILIAVAVLTWVIWLVWRRTPRDVEAGAAKPSALLRVLLAVGVLAAIGLAVDVTLVGHSGAKAVWSGIGSQPAPSGGEGDDD
ncbi:DUF2231 domain-containing protein [Phycicoccus sonneratiae]|uniref:DUF2231 domain-containing protein n=1 Tax=Phycicoccus sonneratiae TaxID=2807628 RepID=A0ABS2CPS7_9MICO|nr:DUF2231 domain-containing protein [Phycicoccus sonneraticus]MBM6401902.1 hypothetical protein [Phycicoccus sonneraticus]